MNEFNHFFDQSFYGNPLRTYISATLIVVLGYFLSRGLRSVAKTAFSRLARVTSLELDEFLVDQAIRPIGGLATLLFWYAGGLLIHLPHSFRTVYHNVLFVVGAVFVASFALTTVDMFYQRTLARWMLRSRLDPQVAVFVRKFLKISIALVLLATTLEHIGLDVLSLLTGLGIGGLAVALAAQQTLGNVLGSIQILSDRPFSVGDWVRAEGFWGEVVDIGLRSTKIRTRGKILVVIPNNKLADGPIENMSVGKNLAVNIDLGLVYETSATSVEEAVKIITEILENQDGVMTDKLIHFLGFDSSSLTISCTYFVTEIRSFWEIQHQVNLRIKSRFDDAGLVFAFPTQTVHVASLPSGTSTSAV